MSRDLALVRHDGGSYSEPLVRAHSLDQLHNALSDGGSGAAFYGLTDFAVQEYAVVRINSKKHSATYSDPIMRSDTIEGIRQKLASKTGRGMASEPEDMFGGFW